MFWEIFRNKDECIHDWYPVSETTTESKAEYAARVLGGIEGCRITALDRYLIQVIACKKCGQVRRFKDTI